MKKFNKTYLMIGGTFLPAFAGIATLSMFSKEPMSAKSIKYVATFAILAAVGGYISAQMIKAVDAPAETDKP